MSPFESSGAAFLWIMLAAVPACAAAGLALRWLLMRPWRRGDPAAIARRLSPEEAAILVSGASRAVEAAIVGLHHRGVIRWADGRLERGLVAAGQTSPIEDLVLGSLPAQGEALLREARRSRVAAKRARALEVRVLLAGSPRRARWIVRLPALAWLAASVGAVGAEVAMEPQWGLLLPAVLGGAAAALLLWIARAPRLTRLGWQVASALRVQLAGRELAMAYAVLGPSAAPETVREVLPSVHAAWLAAGKSPRIRNLAWIIGADQTRGAPVGAVDWGWDWDGDGGDGGDGGGGGDGGDGGDGGGD